MLYRRSNCVVGKNRPGLDRSETQEKEKTLFIHNLIF